MQIENTNKNYYDLIQNFNLANEDYGSKIFDWSGKYFNELNTLDFDYVDKDNVARKLNDIAAENLHYTRTLEKNSLFREENEAKNQNEKKLAETKFDDVNKLTEKSLLELDELEKKMYNNAGLKKLEDDIKYYTEEKYNNFDKYIKYLYVYFNILKKIIV